MNVSVPNDGQGSQAAGNAGAGAEASRLTNVGPLTGERGQEKPARSGNRMQGRSAAGTPAGRVSRRIAKSMLGRSVTLRVATGETVHGIVSAVLLQGAKPRVVVAGFEYDLGQILTVAPPDLPGSPT